MSRMDVLFLMTIFRLYSGWKLSFEPKQKCTQRLSLSACFCWDSRFSLREVDQKFKVAETIGYAVWYLEFLFCHFKVFRLDALDVMMLLQQSCHIVANNRWLLQHWTRTKFMFAWALDWTTTSSINKTLSALFVQTCLILKQYALHCTWYRARRYIF